MDDENDCTDKGCIDLHLYNYCLLVLTILIVGIWLTVHYVQTAGLNGPKVIVRYME